MAGARGGGEHDGEEETGEQCETGTGLHPTLETLYEPFRGHNNTIHK